MYFVDIIARLLPWKGKAFLSFLHKGVTPFSQLPVKGGYIIPSGGGSCVLAWIGLDAPLGSPHMRYAPRMVYVGRRHIYGSLCHPLFRGSFPGPLSGKKALVLLEISPRRGPLRDPQAPLRQGRDNAGRVRKNARRPEAVRRVPELYILTFSGLKEKRPEVLLPWAVVFKDWFKGYSE